MEDRKSWGHQHISYSASMKPDRTGLSLLVSIFVLALAYFITGRLGLLLAIPPGYATAVWPASGVALAVLLLYGSRLWPGILLGSFLIIVTVSFDSSTLSAIVRSLSIAFCVGTGATLQAILGAYLINRYTDIKSGLIKTGSVLRFVGLGGPVSCLVGATWGVTTLWIFNLISNVEYPFNWINWWVGNAIGVIVFLPLVYVFFGRPAETWRWRKMPVAAPLILSIAAVITFFIVASDTEQERIETAFQQRASVAADSMEKLWISYIENLYSTYGLFITTEDIDSDKFQAFVSHSLERMPGIQALGWNPVVSRQQRAAFEMEAQEGGQPGFQINERNAAGDLIRAGSRPIYVPVRYIEPYRGNEKALGFDVYSNPIRKKAMDVARDTGKPAATARIDLVQETSHQAGILVFLPLYQSGKVPEHLDDRRQHLRGYVVGVFRMGDVLATALKGLNISHTETFLFDETPFQQDVALAAYRVTEQGSGALIPLSASKPIENSLSSSTAINIGGRNWRLLVTPSAQYLTEQRSWAAWGVLAGGLIFTALLGTFLLILTGRQVVERQRAEELLELNNDLNNEVAQRHQVEQSLREANERLEQLATVDYLTGLFNRRYIQDFAKRCDAEMQRYHHPYSIILYDLDNFKAVNDRFGHDVGDLVLQEVSRRVASQLRETDCLGRWGGEEFLIVAKQTELANSVEFSQRLCQTVSSSPVDGVGRITVSIGVAWNAGSFSLEETIKQADQALYLAKKKGRNRVEFMSWIKP